MLTVVGEQLPHFIWEQSSIEDGFIFPRIGVEYWVSSGLVVFSLFTRQAVLAICRHRPTNILIFAVLNSTHEMANIPMFARWYIKLTAS